MQLEEGVVTGEQCSSYTYPENEIPCRKREYEKKLFPFQLLEFQW